METRYKLGIIASAMILVAPFVAFADTYLWTTPSWASNDDGFNDKQVEPSVTVDTNSASTIVSAHMHALATDKIVQIYRSTNTGVSWTHVADAQEVHPGFDNQHDPVLTSDNAGNMYLSILGKGITNYGYVGKSTTGTSWTWTVGIGETGNDIDKPWITADSWSTSPYKNNVYLCWMDFSTGDLKFKRYAVAGSSTVPYDSDANAKTLATFLPSVSVAHGCNIAVGPNGAIYVAYMVIDTSQAPFRTIKVQRNFVGGAPTGWDGTTYRAGTFNSFNPITGCPSDQECINGFNNKPFRVNHFPSIAVGANNVVHVAYMTNCGTTCVGDIRYNNSPDCFTAGSACTWRSTSIAINRDGIIPGNGVKDQWEPALTVSKKNGAVIVTVLDRRDDPNDIYYVPYDYHCHYSATVNCRTASSWVNQLVDNNFNANTNLDQSTFIGDYHGIATISSRNAHTNWVDHSSVVAQNFDILFASTPN